MPNLRALTVYDLAICLLLLGEACSGSSERESDASQVVDGLGETEWGDSGGACSGEYISSGCCDAQPTRTMCYFPSRGETVETTRSCDQTVWNPNCTSVGFTPGARYVCCPALPAEATSAATYSAEWIGVGGGMAALRITKMGADCASIQTYAPGENYTRISGSLLNWGLSIGSVGACGDAGAGQTGIGGIGAITLSPGTKTCTVTQVSVHATVFGLTADGSVQAVRMDADNLTATVPAKCP